MLGQISRIHPTRPASSVADTREREFAVIASHAPALVHTARSGQRFEMFVENRRPNDAGGIEASSERVLAKFRVRSAGEAATRISEAVALAELEAYAEQVRGVLVQRHEFDLFSVALSSGVPFGVTIEQDFAFDEHRSTN